MLEGSTLGTLVELMVEAEILAGSAGRLIPSRLEPDVDHRDLVVAQVGGFGALWLQVKGTTHPDREGRVVAFANYPADAIPESPRLLYLVCLLDVQQHLLARLRLVPSADLQPTRVPRALRARGPRDPSSSRARLRATSAGTASKSPDWTCRQLEPLVGALGPAAQQELTYLRDQVR